MPKALERKLLAEAHRKGFSKKRTGAYVYGNPVMKKYLKEKSLGDAYMRRK